MSLVTLVTAKAHLRVEGDDDDTLVELYLDAAQEVAEQYMGRLTYVDEAAIPVDSNGIAINFAIKAAILLITGHLYANREDTVIGVSVAVLPAGSKMLLQPYRVDLLV